VNSAQLQALRAAVGADAFVDDPARIAPLLVDHRELYRGQAAAVAAPREVAGVQELLAFCHAERIGVVPQGGNTSYCGGATPDATGAQVLLSLARLDRIRNVDAANYSMTAEAGCVLAKAQGAALASDRFFPLALGSEGSCQIGGNLATNAGGLNVIRYGMTRDLVLGLEVVLPDGRLLNTLSGMRKDNTGYDVKSLFLGAEGSLGVITAATLKLFPVPRSHGTAFVATPDPDSAVRLFGRLRESSGDRVSSFELIPRVAIELTCKHIADARDPLSAPSPWYVLCELSSSDATEPLGQRLEALLTRALADGDITDAAVAQNERERAAWWRLRESIPAAQRRDGASLKHDVSVPISALPDFVARASNWVTRHVPEGFLVAYGHVGDGNLHFNVNQRAGAKDDALLARAPQIRRAIYDLVQEFRGSFSAEHGIGRLKVAELARYADPVELDVMRALKRTLDPHGIMNPGKVIDV
jgi:FAD/FMN-containing dehydrogenase